MKNEVESTIQEYLQSREISPDTIRLISQARYDLFYGPIYPDADENSAFYGVIEDQEKYPGFSKAVEQISTALDNCIGDIYVDVFSGGWSSSAPEPWEDEDGEIIEPTYEDFVHVSVNDIRKHLLGSDLASYVH